MVLQSHYRAPLTFTEESLEAAGKGPGAAHHRGAPHHAGATGGDGVRSGAVSAAGHRSVSRGDE